MRKHLQPILAASVAALFLLPGLGSSGLLDPWEMDRAANARVVSGPSQVLVLDSEGQLSAALEKHTLSVRRIETDSIRQGLMLAPNRLSERLTHAVVVELDKLKPRSSASWDDAARQLNRLQSENRGLVTLLVTQHIESTKRLLAEARSRQLSRTLRGSVAKWLMPKEPQAMAPLMDGDEFWSTPDQWVDTLQQIVPSPWTQVLHKVNRHSGQGPLLDTWLVAGSLQLFGASELAARLPGALICALIAALLFIAMRLLWGSSTAWLGVFIYLTLPLTVGNARIVTFAQCAPLGIACTGLGLALGVTRRCPRWWLWICSGLLVLLLARGLGGLTMGASILVGYFIVSGAKDRRAWICALGSMLFVALAAWWVLSDDSSALLRSLRFTQVPFDGGIPAEKRDFSTIIGMIGFALYPWGPLFLLAAGQALFRDDDSPMSDASRVLALSFGAPLLAVAILFPGFHQWTLPVAPIVAALTAVWLVELGSSSSQNSLHRAVIALWLIIPTVLLHREIGKEAATLVRWLAWDPPFGGEKAAFQWPQELKLNRGARAISLLLVVSFAIGLTRPLDAIRRAIGWLRSAKVAPRALSVTALLWCLDLLISAGTRTEVVLHGEARRTGYGYDRVWTTIQCTRPEVIAGATAVALLLIGSMSPRWKLWARLGHWLRWTRPKGHIGLAVGAVLAICQLISGLLVWSTLQPTGWSGALRAGLSSLNFWLPLSLLIPVAVAKWWSSRHLLDEQMRPYRSQLASLLRSSSWIECAAVPLLFTIGGIGVGASQAAGTWTYGYLLATWALVAWVVARALLGSEQRQMLRITLAAWWVAALTSASLAFVLLSRLTVLIDSPSRYLAKLFIASPDTAALVALTVFIAQNYLLQKHRFIDLANYFTFELVSIIERPRLRTALPMLAALVLSSSYVFGLLPELGLHFSQKHLLERTGVDPREPDGVLDQDNIPRVFKYAPGGGSVARNFYTQAMPSLTDKGALTKLLAGEDFATQVSDFGPEGRSTAIAVPGWPVSGVHNPPKGVFWGIASKLEGQLISVAPNARGEGQNWQTNQWRGATLISARGQRVQVLTNTADTLEVDGDPALTVGDVERASFHLLPEGLNRVSKSTAQKRQQRFVVVPKDDFSALNFAFRRAQGGRHISVVDARSSRLVLTATHLRTDQKDDSWFRKHVLNKKQFKSLKGVTAVEVNFDDKVFLVGYQMKRPTVRRSQKYELDLYFEVRRGLASSYMIFMHPHPLHRDLWPLAIHPKTKREEKRCTGCFQTNHWLKGDIVRVPVIQEVPLGTNAGQHDVIFGLYNPLNEKRLILKGGKGPGIHVHRDNRVTLTRLTVR
ncbi:MAG: hypothetical protein CMH53_08395 [Myxococcales bacterium]|nr:hypothetical protein [Myxococcales bacterium]